MSLVLYMYNKYVFQKPGNKPTRYLSYGCFNELKNKLDDLGIEEDVPDSEAMTFLHPQYHYLISLYQKYKSCTEIKVGCRT